MTHSISFSILTKKIIFYHLFIQDVFITKPRSGTILLDLIQRTKEAVRELDNLQYRRMKKILMVDSEANDARNNGPYEDIAGDDSTVSVCTSCSKHAACVPSHH